MPALPKEMPMTRALVAALCLAAAPALAFEGVLINRMSSPQKMPDGKPLSATGTIQVKGISTRMESSGVFGTGKQVVITRAAEPGVSYILYPERKTYTRIDGSKEKEDADPADAKKYTIKRLGKEKIAGRTTEHVLVTKAGSSDESEMWIDMNLVSQADMAKAWTGTTKGQSWWGALKKEGLGGIPIKFIHREKDKPDHTVTWEITEVKEQPVPDSAFAIPAGYTEVKMGEGGLSTDQREQMRDQMKKAMENMSPEQKKQLEEMMKQHGSGN
jgi:hypothetical protein